MPAKFFDIESLYQTVSGGGWGENAGYVNRETGETYYYSEYGDSEDELPEDIDDESKYVLIPHKHDLDLGRELVRNFVNAHASHLREHVARCFDGPGAYRCFKILLDSHDLLEAWHQFENSRTEATLREWCKHNNIELVD